MRAINAIPIFTEYDDEDALDLDIIVWLRAK
jgi:hypothetical protein